MAYINIDFYITALSAENGTYKIDASISGVTKAFKHDKVAVEEVSIQVAAWKTLNDALYHLKVRGSEEENKLKEFGKDLFNQVMVRTVYTLYKNAKIYAGDRGHTLRFRLHLATPEIMELPWELLCEKGEFLGLTITASRPRILISRCPIDARNAEAKNGHLPLHVTIMTSKPRNFYETNAEEERLLIKKALSIAESKGYVVLNEIPGTDRELANIYKNRTWDIFHFIGHGSFNDRNQEGELVLEDTQGRGINIPAYKFSMSLPESVKLVFLNACDSARTNSWEPFSSIAYILAKQGRIVIAMQFKISNNAAVRFAEIFYSQLAENSFIDVAVAEARHRVFTMVDCNPFDWASPVLYMEPNGGFNIGTQGEARSTGKFPALPKTTDVLPALIGDTATAPIDLQASLAQTKLDEASLVPTGSLRAQKAADDVLLAQKSFHVPLSTIIAPFKENIYTFWQQHLRLSILSLFMCLLLIAASIVGIIIHTYASTISQACNQQSILYPQVDGSESPTTTFVNQKDMNTSTDSSGQTIGLSAGATVFDIGNDKSGDLQLAASSLKSGNYSSASALLNTVTTNTPANAEAWIYQENLSVLNQKLNYIVVVLGLSIDASSIGDDRDIMQGAYLAQSEYNSQAQQNNCPSLILIIGNSGSNDGNAKQVAQDILTLKKINSYILGVVGWSVSSHTVNANNILAHQPTNNDNVFMLAPSASSDTLNSDLYFAHIIPNDSTQASIMANYAYSTLKYRRIAVLYTNSGDAGNYSSSLYASFSRAFKDKAGANLISQMYTENDATSIKTALQKALSFNPGGIYFAGYASDVALLLAQPQIASLPKSFQIMGGDALDILSDYAPIPSHNLERIIFTAFASPAEWQFLHVDRSSVVATFKSDYETTFRSSTINTSAMLTYDAVNVLIQSYKMALTTGTSKCLPCEL